MKDEKPNNPSAFPVAATEQSYYNQSPLMPESGMTLRDYFAAKAMQSIISNRSMIDTINDHTIEWASKHAYSISDAMLKQREL